MDEAQARLILAQAMRRVPIRYYKPHPTAAKFHLDEHLIRIIFGPNKSGKTYAIVAENVAAMTGVDSIHCAVGAKYPKPPIFVQHWCTDLTRNVEKVLLPLYVSLIPPDMLDTARGRQGFTRDTATLYLKNGSWVQFLSYELARNKGESIAVHIVSYDEPPKEEIYDGQPARVTKFGGFITGAMTPWAGCVPWPIDWLERRVWRGKDGDAVACWRMHLEENKANLDWDKTMLWAKMLCPEEYAARIEGFFGRLSGLVYRDFDRDVHAAYDKIAPGDFPKLAKAGYGRVWCGFDHGMNDPTACAWFYVADKPLERYDIAEHDVIQFREYKRPGTVQYHQAVLKALNGEMMVQGYLADPHMWEKDPLGGQTIASAYMTAGFRMFKGNTVKQNGWNKVNILLAPADEQRKQYAPWPRLRLCKAVNPETEDEYLGYCWKPPNQSTGKGGDRDMDVNDHLMDATRYFACGSWEVRPAPEPEPLVRDRLTGMPAALLYSLPGVRQ